MQVRAVLFPRRDIATVGIAPLTSMYFFGPDRRAGIDDFRNAVYDSEGLRMVNGPGERLWRPLRNPTKVETSAFADENPRAFGLIQRSRSFATSRTSNRTTSSAPAPGSSPAKAGARAR